MIFYYNIAIFGKYWFWMVKLNSKQYTKIKNKISLVL